MGWEHIVCFAQSKLILIHPNCHNVSMYESEKMSLKRNWTKKFKQKKFNFSLCLPFGSDTTRSSDLEGTTKQIKNKHITIYKCSLHLKDLKEKYGEALYLCGGPSVATLGKILMLLWPMKILKLSKLSLGRLCIYILHCIGHFLFLFTLLRIFIPNWSWFTQIGIMLVCMNRKKISLKELYKKKLRKKNYLISLSVFLLGLTQPGLLA